MATALSDLVANPTAHRYYDLHRLGAEHISLQGFCPDACELSRETANAYGVDVGATAAAIPLSQLDDRFTMADRHNLTFGDINLSDSQFAGESLATAGLDDLTLEDLGLDDYRDRTLDVAVFDGDTLMHIAEVQRRSGVKNRTRRNFSKLKALGELGVTAHWCCPTITDLRSVMSQLDHPDYLNFENRPDRSPETDRPSLWRRKLSTADLWQRGIETLSTHRSIEVVRDD
ncbi:hypothetical protein [Halomicrobium katesii]|uniref:hypothetical protein n=1 Tax=Halomicrobium katesii TaxID=437163 RepID=UPI0012BAA349|nr:hypothetical protein [Halomicrobium katesii]